jgi:hypothetical protein
MAQRKRPAHVARSRPKSVAKYDAEKEKALSAAAITFLNGFKLLDGASDEFRLSFVRAILMSFAISPKPNLEIVRQLREFREALHVPLTSIALTLDVSVHDLTRMEESDASFLSATALKKIIDVIRLHGRQSDDVMPYFNVVYSVLAYGTDHDLPALAASANEYLDDESVVSVGG